MRTYDPTEFLAKARTANLSNPSELVVVGLAKADDDPGHILYSPGRACTNWVRIPTGVVQAVDHLRDVACKDHHHPLVRIKFKRPEDVAPEVAAFMALLASAQKEVALARLKATSPNMQAGDCAVVDIRGLGVCCVVEDASGNLEVECTGMA